jgi:hypothetical protein
MSTEQLELRIVNEIASIERESWDALLRPDDNPFVGWTFLEALERSGCASAERGWWPRHLTVWMGDHLLAASPAYIKTDSAGDFSRDWGFAESAARANIPYYPKLVVGVPFSPVTGRRALIREGLDQSEFVGYLVSVATELARQAELSSVHVLYHHPDECQAFESAGLCSRIMTQYHWHNRDYETTEDWLGDLKSKRRTQIRRERREPAKQGIVLRTIRDEELRADARGWARQAHRLYQLNTQKHFWGGAYLNLAFFERVCDKLSDSVELVVAERDGKVVAGAFNIATPSHLFGRYWGCSEEHRFLHFNVCLYHSIDECIRRSVQVFEGGAGGEHKLSRGFDPAFVYSSHLFLHEGFHDAVRRHFAAEAAAQRDAMEAWRRPSSV